MKHKSRVELWLAIVVVVFSLSAIGFATAGMLKRKVTDLEPSTDRNSLESIRSKRSAYVRKGLLSQRLIKNLSALGNRLEKPGKERLTVTGSWRGPAGEEREFVANLEFPDRLRLVIQNGAHSRVITFDGEEIKTVQIPPAARELDLIESLLYDSAEHFFAAQLQGNAIRFLGFRFRMDDGSTPEYRGPYFDIYQVADQIKASGQERAAKLYYFNSDTFMLERVTYVINRDGAEINVETRVSDWRETEGQRVARRIERFENGKSVLVLNLGSAQHGARVQDGSFSQ